MNDLYEFGSFTPIAVSDGPVTYTKQSGHYRYQGERFEISMVIGGHCRSGLESIRHIEGLPFGSQTARSGMSERTVTVTNVLTGKPVTLQFPETADALRKELEEAREVIREVLACCREGDGDCDHCPVGRRARAFRDKGR